MPPLPPARVVTVPVACAEAWGNSRTESSRARSDNTMLDRFARAIGLGQRRCKTTDRVVVAMDLACSRSMHKIDDVKKDAITVSRQRWIEMQSYPHFIMEHNVYSSMIGAYKTWPRVIGRRDLIHGALSRAI